MIKVAAYCRVSTDKDDQANSFDAQQRYFRAYIESQPDWELYEIYADEGITGTSTKKRIRFNQMIGDAHEGRFSLILTKEVSRFSRNILDTISYTRELKKIGVGVLFVTDRIHTLDPEAEMLLSFLASMAQEESRKTSQRVVWGQTRQMEKGIVFGHSLLGYDLKDGNLTVNPEESTIVQMIFQKYALEQVSTSKIAEFLTKEGYQTHGGSTHWNSGTVIKILKNEKYTGDLIQKKSYTPDYLTHEKKRNTGQVPLIVQVNHHEPIITRELWVLAQKRLQQNRKNSSVNSGHSNRYIFSGKIKCGECGSVFLGRMKAFSDGRKLRRWSCGGAVRGGTEACSVRKILRDDDAMMMLKTAIRSLRLDTAGIVHDVTSLAMDAVSSKSKQRNNGLKRLEAEICRTEGKIERLLDRYLAGTVSEAEMFAMREKYQERINSVRRTLETELYMQENYHSVEAEIAEYLTMILNGQEESEAFFKTMLHSITIYKNRVMELRINHLTQIFRFQG